MKLRNKKTGKIEEVVIIPVDENGYPNEFRVFEKGESLAELNKEWEDYKEESLKPYWFINDLNGSPMQCDVRQCNKDDFIEWAEQRKQIGNYFENKEQAEKAVEKLKAWKRLKDKGFRINDWNASRCELYFDVPDSFFPNYNFITDETRQDLDLLFGDEE